MAVGSTLLVPIFIVWAVTCAAVGAALLRRAPAVSLALFGTASARPEGSRSGTRMVPRRSPPTRPWGPASTSSSTVASGCSPHLLDHPRNRFVGRRGSVGHREPAPHGEPAVYNLPHISPGRYQQAQHFAHRVDAERPSCVHDPMVDDRTLRLTTNSPEAEAVAGERLVDFEVFFDREKAGSSGRSAS